MTVKEMYDYLIEVAGVSVKFMTVIIAVNGFKEETMKNVLYAITGQEEFPIR